MCVEERKKNEPSLTPSVSQCALNTKIPFGLYFSNNAGPKSAKKRARGPLGPCESPIGLRRKWSGICSMGDPCPKKNAGIFSGVDGNSARAARHSASVRGMEGASVPSCEVVSVAVDMFVVLVVVIVVVVRNRREAGEKKRRAERRVKVNAIDATARASMRKRRVERGARMLKGVRASWTC